MGNDAVGFARKGACGLEGNVLQQNYGNFRIYPSDNWGICFVYEYEKGLSIWKEGITIEQKEKIKEDLIGSISDFHFIDNEFHNNTTYVMAFNQNEELMFKDEE